MKRKPVAVSNVSITVLANQGNSLMADGKWREAVEVYKQLLKQEPDGGWVGPLGEAYSRRAEELAGKKMFKEALMLLDNADRLTTTPHQPLLRLACLVALGRAEAAVTFYLRAEAHLQITQSVLSPVAAEYVAALLLTQPTLEHCLPVTSPWREQLTAARAALTAFCHPDGTDLEPLLGRISMRSPFKPLRLILKSLLLVQDQADKAQQLAASIAPSSPWAGMVRLVSLCTMKGDQLLRHAGELTPPELEFVGEWRGVAPTRWSKIRALLTAAPEQQLTLLLDPTTSWSLPEASLRRAAFLLLVHHPKALPAFEKRFGVLDTTETSRLTALSGSVTGRDRPAAWLVYLRRLSAEPETPERNMWLAMTHRLLAALILDEDHDDHRGVVHLEDSLALDAKDQKSYLMLLDWYKKRDDDKKSRQILDQALRHFPDNAQFLYEAVQQALQGTAFKKASRLAKRLLTIDPLHARVRRDLIRACLAHARKQVRGGRLDLAEKELAEAATWERPEERNGIVRINQALWHWLAQRTPEGDALLAQGIQEAGGGLAAHFRATMEGLCLRLPLPMQARLAAGLAGSVPLPVTCATVLALVRVANDYTTEPAIKKQLLGLSKVWTRAQRLPFSVEELRTVCQFMATTELFSELRRYALLGEKNWPDQPVFIYYRLFAKCEGSSENLSHADYDKISAALHLAEEGQDHALAQTIRDWVYDDDDDWDDDDDDDEFDFAPKFLKDLIGASEGTDRDVAVIMLAVLGKSYMSTQKHNPTREEMEKFLLGALATAPTEVKKQMHDTTLLPSVLDRLFPNSAGKPSSLPVAPPNPPPTRGRARRE